MVSYIKFKGQEAERDLIKSILSSANAYAIENFPRVKVIGRTSIHPDIDILQIKKENHSERLIGFETKIIKYEKGNRWNWEEFYKGIGEAFLYLQFGLNQCGLIIGFHSNVSDELIKKFSDDLENKRELLKKILGEYFNLGIYL